MELFRQRTLRQFLEYCRERAKENIQRCKKKAKWYWPELHLYCGVCKLSTGIYIRSALCLVIYIIATVLNILMAYYIIERGRFLFSMDMSALEDYYNLNLTDDNVVIAKKVYTLFVAYLIAWCIFKMLYTLSLISTIYAIYKKKPKILKLVLFNNTLNWILNIILSLFGAVLTQIFSKALVAFCILLEGYNLLALSSEYKQMKGKSKLVINIVNTNPNVEGATAPITDASNQTEGDTRHILLRHCETCSCNLEPILQTNSETRSTVPASNVTTGTPVEEEKQLNIKDIEIIFNQDQLLQHNSSVLENNRDIQRPRVLELSPYVLEKEKKIQDMVVIYDENQLHIGGSPVIESQENRQFSD